MSVMCNSLFSILVITAIISDVTHGQSETSATVGQFKYVASIWLRGSYKCGGAILNERYILTAGHCIKGIGAIDLRVVVGVIQVTNSSKWHQLLDDLVFDATIQPIGLSALVDPVSHQPCKLAFYREEGNLCIRKVYVSLWWAPVLIASRGFCVGSYSHIFPHQICVFNPENHLKPVGGDSGSPVAYDHKLFGIVQSAVRDQYGPVIITLIAPYERFIRNVISGTLDNSL